MGSQYRSDCNKTLIYIIFGAIVFFVFILPVIDSYNQKEINKLKEKLENNTDISKLDKNKCSKQCCKHTQWPTSIGKIEGNINDEELKNYIGTNLSCNFGDGSGCLCVSKEEFNYLTNRGGNSKSSMCT